jgi:leader peptidase (prepilin peptidase) / N-methyltransferase
MAIDPILFYFLLFAFFSTLFGACVGSFLNVCIYRIPRDESVVTPRSHCPHCGSLIPWYLNIPVLSWCCLRGRCASCKGPIALRYTLVELLTAALFLAVYMQWFYPEALHMHPIPAQHPLLVLIYWLFVSGLVLGTFVDFEHYIIPDSVTIGGMIVGPILSALVPSLHGQDIWWKGLLTSGLGLSVGFLSLFAISWIGEKIFKKEAMGFGDVKLLGAIGAFLGWPAVLFTIVASSFLGSIVGLTLIAFRSAKLQSEIPFGPYIAAGALLWAFYGPPLLKLYLKTMSV